MTKRLFRVGFFGLIMAPSATLVLLPIASFFIMSFWRVKDNTIVTAFTFANYAGFFEQSAYWGTFLFTLEICASVSLIGVLIGYPVSYFIWRRKDRTRYPLLILLILPLFMSYIVKIYTMRAILGYNGILNHFLVDAGILKEPSTLFLYNRAAILITMTVVFMPFVVLPIFLALERIPNNLIDASADLGGGPSTTFRRVILPLSLPGTVAGALFTFVLALGDFITPQMVGGPNGFTFGRAIWSQFGLAFDWPFGAALAVILFLFAIVSIVMASLAGRRAVS